MKKTALTQLIEMIQSSKQEVDVQGVGICEVIDYHGIEDKAKELLEVERQDLEDTYDKGMGAMHPTGHGMSFDEYYNEKFNQA